jgi:beta-glucosidase
VTGQPIGNPGQPFFLFDVPWAFRKMLHYIQERYLEPCGIPLFITENGFAVKDEQDKAKADCLADTERVNYFKGYLAQLASAVSEDGLQCCGYMAWTLMEWVPAELHFLASHILTVSRCFHQ